jgi:hypothetical protein
VTAEQKKNYWGEERNARRREKYNSDKANNERIRQARKESYDRVTGRGPIPNCLGNAAKVPSSGQVMAVQLDGSDFVIGRVFTQADVAELLNRGQQVIYRWHQRGVFPSPVLADDRGNRFYSDAEVLDFIQIMGELQQITVHYRAAYHKEFLDRLNHASFEHNRARGAAWIKERAK